MKTGAFFISELKEGDTFGHLFPSQRAGQHPRCGRALRIQGQPERHDEVPVPSGQNAEHEGRSEFHLLRMPGERRRDRLCREAVWSAAIRSRREACGRYGADGDCGKRSESSGWLPPESQAAAFGAKAVRQGSGPHLLRLLRLFPSFERVGRGSRAALPDRGFPSPVRRGDAQKGLCGVPSGPPALRFKGRQGIRPDRQGKGGKRS